MWLDFVVGLFAVLVLLGVAVAGIVARVLRKGQEVRVDFFSLPPQPGKAGLTIAAILAAIAGLGLLWSFSD